MSNYTNAISIVENALKFGINPSLEGIYKLCEKLGQPQEHFDAIQVAGTNGKTSTTRFIASILRAHGLKVGLYTSPHIIEYPERIELDGAVVSREVFAKAIFDVRDAANQIEAAGGDEITEFEYLTAAAFLIFAEAKVDVAVVETGLGGRWDATSILQNKVAVITGISLDHTHILGDTLKAIAAEKAQIIKSGSKVVISESVPEEVRDVFEGQAELAGGLFCVSGWRDIHKRLRKMKSTFSCRLFAHATPPTHTEQPPNHFSFPSYQTHNIEAALVAALAYLDERFNIDLALEAIKNTKTPGRFELLFANPTVILDGAHNKEATDLLAKELGNKDGEQAKKFTLLLGILADKDARGIIESLAPTASEIAVTTAPSQRAIPAQELAAICEEITGAPPRVFETPEEALKVLTQEQKNILITGSITMALPAKQFFATR